MDSRFRGNDEGHMDSRFRGNDEGHMDSRFRGNDEGHMDSRGADASAPYSGNDVYLELLTTNPVHHTTYRFNNGSGCITILPLDVLPP